MFVFDKINSEDFDVIKDSNTSLEIIVHKETGFFNITKIAALVMKLKIEEQVNAVRSLTDSNTEPVGISTGSGQSQGIPPGISSDSPRMIKKEARKWFCNALTKKLLEAYKTIHNPEAVKYELKRGTLKQFAGTYLHPGVSNHFMMWLDTTYADQVSDLLDSHRLASQNEENARTKLLEEKIDKLTNQLNTLLDDAKEAKKERKEISDHVENLKADVDTAVMYGELSCTMLEGWSKKSTMNPQQEGRHHYTDNESNDESDEE